MPNHSKNNNSTDHNSYSLLGNYLQLAIYKVMFFNPFQRLDEVVLLSFRDRNRDSKSFYHFSKERRDMFPGLLLKGKGERNC